MTTSKIALGILGATGVSGGGTFVAYKIGVFSKNEKPLTVGKRLHSEEYELIKSDEKHKEIFKALKGKPEFIIKLNKYKEIDNDLSSDEDGTKGGAALKKMCSSLVESSREEDFKNASEWCVLRIQDRMLSEKSWISTSEGNEEDWKRSFTAHKDAMIAYGVKGIQSGTQENDGHPHVKEWCSNNIALPMNKHRKTIFDNASNWCTKNLQPVARVGG